MNCKRLQLHHFKNFPEADILLHPKINIFVGDNGVGKTNLLDAIHYLSFCKSFYNNSDQLNIRHGEDFFAIHGFFYDVNVQDNVQVSCVVKPNTRKVFKFNKKEYQRMADHIGLIPLVMVSPYDVDLINQGSEHRRRYFDGVVSQFDRLYLDDLINYNKVLQQRNVLLKTMAEQHRFEMNSIHIWDVQMIELGQRIHERRRSFLESLKPVFQEYYEFLTNGREKIDIEYQSQINERNYADVLSEAIERDRYAQYSTVGIHKDDYVFLMNDYPVKRFGSQGQQKSFLMALKLAQFSYTNQVKNVKPLLLLDDIFDKLDESRVSKVIELAGDGKLGQVFISDTHLERIEKLFAQLDISYKCFKISDNQIFELNT